MNANSGFCHDLRAPHRAAGKVREANRILAGFLPARVSETLIRLIGARRSTRDNI
jgi:hypothetical protein